MNNYLTLHLFAIILAYDTLEKLQCLMKIPKVQKRDGTLEEFDPSKTERVVKATGLNDEDAKKLSAKVASRVYIVGHSPICSLDIRDIVLEELRKVNDNAANLYQWYEKTKEIKTS